MTEVSRDYTINLHKRLFKTTFKVKAPKAVKEGVSKEEAQSKINEFIS